MVGDRPELFAAYVGTGQVVKLESLQSEDQLTSWLMPAPRKDGDTTKELEKLHPQTRPQHSQAIFRRHPAISCSVMAPAGPGLDSIAARRLSGAAERYPKDAQDLI